METTGQPVVETVVEKRLIPRDQMTESQQASVTVSKRFEGQTPSDKEIDGLAGTEGYKLRVRALLEERDRQKSGLGMPVVPRFRGLHSLQVSSRESSLDAQARSYLEQMLASGTHGYELAHSVLFDNNGMRLDEEYPGLIQPPTAEEAMQILGKLTPGEVDVFKEFMEEPEVSFDPKGLGWGTFTRGIDAGVQYPNKTLVGEDRIPEFDRQDELLGINDKIGGVTGWDISICDGSREGPASHIGFLKEVIDRVWERGGAKAHGLQLHTHQSYALAQMRARASGRPTVQGRELLDSDGWTVLQRADNGEVVCPGGKTVTGGCDGWQVLGLHRTDISARDYQKGHYSGIRFRPRMVIRGVK